MIQDTVDDPAALSVAELRTSYEDRLRETIDALGAGTVASDAGVPRRTVDALAAEEDVEVTLEEAAAVLALDAETPDADAIRAEALDALMMGMSMAVVDVETLSSDVGAELEPKEIQQMIEGRFPVSLGEYARIHHAIETRKR
ncbi:DUF5791 family protein [Halomarina oriensis]|uniref:Uncharacterized protein n=1 Tax=Halomarina oriensis TaxID=671145 RepID=A0A6B0GRU7_9EURY|nr:DUF5791 family protein [Halomarina oriensis]MWG35423.1 hypothetical protein [Halomarina oriensis]